MPWNFTRAEPGDKQVSASAFNTCVEGAERILRPGRNQAAGAAVEKVPAGIVKAKNNSGGNIGPFEVLGINGVLVEPSEDPSDLYEFLFRFALAGGTPTLPGHRGKFMITQEPIDADKPGRAMLIGVTPVTINITNTAHGFADVKDGDATQLQSANSGGAQILWKPAGIGEKLCLVRIGAGAGTGGGTRIRIGKTIGFHAKGTTQEIQIYEGGLGTETLVDEELVPSHNKFADVEDDRWVAIAESVDGWYLIAAECFASPVESSSSEDSESEPESSDPPSSDPESSEPPSSEPPSSEPESSEPDSSEPPSSDPESSEPASSEPESSEPPSSEPESSEPPSSDPESSAPPSSEPESSEPESSAPPSSDPESSEPPSSSPDSSEADTSSS